MPPTSVYTLPPPAHPVLLFEEHAGTDRPWPIQSTAAPGLAAVGRVMEPNFNVRRNLIAANPPLFVVHEKDRTIKDRIDRIAAGPLRTAPCLCRTFHSLIEI